jgi:hypothetical protein
MTEVVQDGSVETLPASPSFLAVRIAIVAPLIPILWLWLGAAAFATAVALACAVVLFAPRALVLDEEGFRRLLPSPPRGGRALSASELSALLNDRLASARAGSAA